MGANLVKNTCHSTHPLGQPRWPREQGVPWIMDETYLQCPGSKSSDRWIAADALLREEPDEDEEEDEEEHDGDEEDDDGDEGYSE